MTAVHFRVSVSFVVNLMKAVRMRGSLTKPRGGRRHAKLEPHRAFFGEGRRESRHHHAGAGGRWPPPPARRPIPLRCHVGSFASAIGSKKTLRASEHDRPDIKASARGMDLKRQPLMRLEPHRLVFLDETGTTTKMTRLRGRSLRGRRLLSKVPFGHWKTQTFIAGLRCDALTAPFVIDAPMDRRIFETYVETQLAPTVKPGDIVILDNLAAHKSAAAEQAIRAIGAGLFSSALYPRPQSDRDGFRKVEGPSARQRRPDHRRPLARNR